MEIIRGSGLTKRQMEEAPKNAVYVWCNHHLYYPEQLARFINRRDLKIVSPSWITSERWRGASLTGIIVDHATWEMLSPKSAFPRCLRIALSRVNPNSAGEG